MATFEIITIPIGSQFTQTIGTDDADDLNDFSVLIIANENVTGLVQSSLSVSSGSVVSLTGEKSVWEVVIRPPETAEVLTFTIAADAVAEGNAETEKDIRISTSFPDADAETPTELFSLNLSIAVGIAVLPTRILISSSHDIHFYTHDGIEQTAERMNIQLSGALDAFNDDFLFCNGSAGAYRRYMIGNTTPIETYTFLRSNSIFHTRLGIIGITSASGALQLLPYGKTAAADRIELNVVGDFFAAAHQGDLIYFKDSENSGYYVLARITDGDNVEPVKRLNINQDVGSFNMVSDSAIYQDTLYSVHTNFSTSAVYTLDIRPYRPLSLNTKTTIYPVFANEGDTIDLTQYSPDAERIVPDVGFDKPDYLTFNTNNELEIDADAVTETGPVYIPLKAINRIGCNRDRIIRVLSDYSAGERSDMA